MQIKTTMRYHFTLIKIYHLKTNEQNNKGYWRFGEIETLGQD